MEVGASRDLTVSTSLEVPHRGAGVDHPSSGYYLVTETYTTDIPAPDGNQGLDGGAIKKRTAQNRVRWKSVVEALCSGQSE